MLKRINLSILSLLLIIITVLIPVRIYAEDDNTDKMLDDFMKEEYVNNDALLIAYEAFKQVVDTVELTDQATLDFNGATPEEVIEQIDVGVEPERESDDLGNTILRYYFQGEEDNLITGDPARSEMMLFFHQDALEYVGVITPDFDMSKEGVPDIETVNRWSESLTPYSELVEILEASENQPILGFATIKLSDAYYPQLVLTANDPEKENPEMLMIALEDDQILAVATTTSAALYVKPQENMMGFYSQLIPQLVDQ